MDSFQPNPDRSLFKYFDLYGSMRAHKVMLEDMTRMKAYHAAIFDSQSEAIADKIVLDVGTGTGVLAVWAAKAGAKRVYAVDASNAAKLAMQLVESSQVADVVKVLHGKIEEIDIPEPVDAIVSEWMGSLLLKESMFDSVAYARDKWLKSGGLMLPSHATIWLGLYAPNSSAERDRTHFVRAKLEKEILQWHETVRNLQCLDVDYSPFTDDLIGDLSARFLHNAIRVNYLSPEDLVALPQKALEFDCATVDPSSLIEFSQDFEFVANKPTEIKGILGWFTVDFPNGTVLDTGPGSNYNHWGQQLYPLERSLNVLPGDKITGTIHFRRSPDEPRLNIVEFQYQVGDGSRQTAIFTMGDIEHMDEGSKSVLFS